ncbi:hypothetical protein KL86DYS2_10761 [uncultured Dysgonomonas sp.]|uniref:Uncharacterized protein n=1 Tax=uncultured Dysgonomonas sp. TaxID=206096 RepID=A0A212J585_9BACT|nr:hypothetical protein KL86DYS2_10761 [uncultured Dysgonomonas sp.]
MIDQKIKYKSCMVLIQIKGTIKKLDLFGVTPDKIRQIIYNMMIGEITDSFFE